MWRILLLAVALAGCASTPEASRERDAEAKQFNSRPDAAVIYVYRDDFGTDELPSGEPVLYVDNRLIGATLPQTFLRFDVRAGERVLHGYTHHHAALKLDARPGEVYFVSLQAPGGISHFSLVDPESGKRDILRCCALLENWEPGQRRLLR